jgi:tRNA pseudouridine55 synthase
LIHLAGALLIDKPAGPTSHDVVAVVRRALETDRAGHTGTLDPLATGLLIVLVGSATRLAQFLAADEKEYVADVRLGMATATYDASGLEPQSAWREAPLVPEFTEAQIDAVLERFRGTFLQTPPPYSAKKIGSVPAYEKARRNQPVDLKPVAVSVRELELLDASPIDDRPTAIARCGLVRLRVAAAAGFYVRSLAHDIGQALGCGAHLERLRRTRVGRFRIEDALTLDRLESEGAARLTSPNDLLGHMPAVGANDDGVRRIAHGNPIGPVHMEQGGARLLPTGAAVPFLRVVDGAGRLIAVAEPRGGGILQPIVVLR